MHLKNYDLRLHQYKHPNTSRDNSRIISNVDHVNEKLLPIPPTMRSKSRVWSHVFFLIPLCLAIYAHLWIHTALISLVIICSTAFHLSKERHFGILDKTCVYGLIGYNLYLCYLSQLHEPYVALALVFVGIGLYFLMVQKKDDRKRHLAGSMITMFCILAYIIH